MRTCNFGRYTNKTMICSRSDDKYFQTFYISDDSFACCFVCFVSAFGVKVHFTFSHLGGALFAGHLRYFHTANKKQVPFRLIKIVFLKFFYQRSFDARKLSKISPFAQELNPTPFFPSVISICQQLLKHSLHLSKQHASKRYFVPNPKRIVRRAFTYLLLTQ